MNTKKPFFKNDSSSSPKCLACKKDLKEKGTCTKRCKFFIEGEKCKHGERCHYRHDKIRPTGRKCFFCEESMDTPNSCTSRCKYHISNGFCILGEKCHYKHGDECTQCGMSVYTYQACVSICKQRNCDRDEKCHYRHVEEIEDMWVIIEIPCSEDERLPHGSDFGIKDDGIFRCVCKVVEDPRNQQCREWTFFMAVQIEKCQSGQSFNFDPRIFYLDESINNLSEDGKIKDTLKYILVESKYVVGVYAKRINAVKLL